MIKPQFNRFRRFTHSLRGKYIVRELKSLIKEIDTVLDIGAFNGLMTNYIFSRIKARVSIADIEDYREFDFPFHKIRDNKIDVEDKSFDVCLICDTLHHIKKEEQILLVKEAERIGKKVIIWESYGIVPYLMDKYLHKDIMECNLSFRKPEEMQNLLDGYKLKKVNTAIYYPMGQYLFYKDFREMKEYNL